jgi:hypothetical protein
MMVDIWPKYIYIATLKLQRPSNGPLFSQFCKISPQKKHCHEDKKGNFLKKNQPTHLKRKNNHPHPHPHLNLRLLHSGHVSSSHHRCFWCLHQQFDNFLHKCVNMAWTTKGPESPPLPMLCSFYR